MGNFQAYPSCRYHYSGKNTLVKNPEEEAALGGGWANSPAEWTPYQGPRQPKPQHQLEVVKWVDQWSVEGLSEGHRRGIKSQLLKAHAAFWRSPNAPNADTEAMRLAFDRVAQVLFDAGLLTEQLLEQDLPLLVWDSAIAGGWWRFASETRSGMFPERLGHYWVWRDDSRDWNMLFMAEAAEWRARLLEVADEAPVEPDRPASPTETEVVPPCRAKRLRSTITSPVAARRLEGFLERSNIGPTEFASRVPTTDRTLRAFRQTGKVRRDIFDAIARAMGTSKESLLKP